MKIALIRQRVGWGLGGAENYAASCARELARQGHEVTVIADYCNLPEVRFLRAPVLGRGSVAKNLSFFLMVRRLLEREKFDLVYTCARTGPSDFLRVSDPLHAVWIKLGYRYGNPRLRALRLRHRTILWLEKKSLQEVRRAVIANSNLVKGQLQEAYGLDSGRVKVLYNGVDFRRFNLGLRRRRRELRKEYRIVGKKALLFVGSDWWRKGLDLALKIVPKLAHDSLLLVAGGRARRARKNVRYLGNVRDVERLYAATDALVLPTRYDPFANVVLEALACGLPVVTSRFNGAAEVVRQGETGFVVENTPESLLRAVSGLLASPPSSETCHRSVAHLTWENHVKGLLSLL